MRTIEEMGKDVDEIIQKVKSGKIDLKKVEMLIDGEVLPMVKLWKSQLEFYELRKEKPPEHAPSKKQIEEFESKVFLAKEEIEKLKG
ncbi:MAG TPA: hypothetical protein VMW72_21470 [Sedimentisphaerales bacterium]|nr:hypothetical protein [Sedimentisphaerales bacterium]